MSDLKSSIILGAVVGRRRSVGGRSGAFFAKWCAAAGS